VNDHAKARQPKFPIVLGFFWFITSIAGLWFVVRRGDPEQISGDLVLAYVGFMAINFFAFEWGKICGGVFYEWWANYILVFISAAASSIVLWFIWGFNSIRSTPYPLGEIWTIDAVRRSNFAAMLFLVLIVPACYGAYSQHKR
jgi:hypothetical protein